ncbi:MAG: M28 family peptidase [Terriglobia bacterium]
MSKRFARLGCLVALLVCAGASTPQRKASSLDGKLAYSHVERLVGFGPRPPGSPAIARSQAYITEALKKLNLHVEHQDFLANTPNGPVSMKNIVGKTRQSGKPVVILGSHYDTKVMTNGAFVGANDGGSSTGLLLELARVLSQRRNAFTVWFVFFDGEEAQREWSETDSLYGSRYFVEKLKADSQTQAIKAMVLMDMVGDRDLKLENDASSSPWLMELVRRSAVELGYSKYLAASQKGMVDDHVPFIRAGIPAVDLIDYEYGFNSSFWHTPKDTLDKISPRSLKIVGDIVVRAIENLGQKP